MRRWIAATAIAALVSCEPSKPPPKTRALIVRGLPTCPREGRLARPIVARIDDEPGLFGEPFTLQKQLDVSPRAQSEPRAGHLELTLPRRRMKATIRVGTCRATSMATWDCAAATWLFERALTIDDGTTPVEVMATGIEVACAK